ncbi:MAG: magnesium transporter CorA family protein [Patescibacteria group bacterium]
MAARLPKSIKIAEAKNINWAMVRKNDNKTLDYLRDEFYYHEIDLTDVGPPMQSAKFSGRPDYAFLVLQFPVLDQKTKQLHIAEVDFFLEKNKIVTVDTYGVPDLQQMFDIYNTAKSPPKTTQRSIADDTPHLAYLIINDLIEGLYPTLRDLSSDLELIEDRLFDDYDKQFFRELLRVKTNIVRFRQAMEGMDEALQKTADYLRYNLKMKKHLDDYFKQLSDDTRDIKNRLYLAKETIDALHETNQSLTDFRTNEIIKTLTIVSFIVFPLTLMAGVFGMNAINMPFVNHPLGFWMIIGLMSAGCLTMLGFFKYKRWM